MPEILVRNLSLRVLNRLKARAKGSGRSLQAEVRTILERSLEEPNIDGFRKAVLRIQKKLARHTHSDSTLQIREDREQ